MHGIIVDYTLEDDDNLHRLLAFIIHDTNPVYLLKNVTKNIIWIMTKNKIRDNAKENFVDIYYLRLNMIDDYKYVMGGVDVAYQLCLHYRLECCIIKRYISVTFLFGGSVWMQQINMSFDKNM